MTDSGGQTSFGFGRAPQRIGKSPTMSLEQELIELISKEALVDVEKLQKDATLEQIGLDSVDLVSVVFAVEDKYGVTIGENDLEKTATLGDMLNLIAGKIDEKAAPK
jgi:acyl carrier protein